MPTKWREEYAVGDREIDEQHQQLFGAINRLEVLVLSNQLDPEAVDGIVEFLDGYTRTHFAHE